MNDADRLAQLIEATAKTNECSAVKIPCPNWYKEATGKDWKYVTFTEAARVTLALHRKNDPQLQLLNGFDN